jgi:hypothetical protein
MSKPPHRMRLRNEITVVNGITGETAPTYGEYVLASDYDAAEARIKALEARLSKIGSITDIRAIWRIAAGFEDAALSPKGSDDGGGSEHG